MSKHNDLTGNKYNRWFVESYIGTNKHREAMYHCICECGNEGNICGRDLVSGKSKSCGCYKSDVIKEAWRSGYMKPTKLRHGMAHSRIYKIWTSMKSRCSNPNLSEYKYYGGCGICVCDEWLNNFESFYDWSLMNGYDDSLTIDRIDVNGNYSPDNCRWVPMSVQANNKRTTRYLTFNGITRPIREWRSEFGFGRGVIEGRLSKGWSVEDALTTPASLHNKRHRR